MKKRELLNVALYLFAFLTIQAITVAAAMLISQSSGMTASITTITTLASSIITIALFYKLRWTPCSGAYINTRPWFTMFWPGIKDETVSFSCAFACATHRIYAYRL